MKRIGAIALLIVSLSACGVNGTVVETNRIGDECSVTIHKNNTGKDRDDTYPIPCEIKETP